MVVTLTVLGLIIRNVIKKKKKSQDAAFKKFITSLENTTEPEKIDQAVISRAFSTSYWREVVAKKGSGAVITELVAIELAKKIAAAWNGGFFWDDLEDEVYRAFEDHRLKTFGDVSRVADAYGSDKVLGRDLWQHLEYKLSDSEFAKVKSIVIKKIAI